MKTLIFGLIGCLLYFQCSATDFQEVDGKLYISPGSVYVAPDAIYVNIDGNFIAVEGVFSDSNGVYIQPLEFRYMYCLKCKKYHDPAKTPCQ